VGRPCSAAFSQMASVALSWRAPLEGLANRDATSDCAEVVAQRHEQQFDADGVITSALTNRPESWSSLPTSPLIPGRYKTTLIGAAVIGHPLRSHRTVTWITAFV